MADEEEASTGSVLDAVLAEVHVPRTHGPWREQLRQRSLSARSALLRHPWALTALAARGAPVAAALHPDAVSSCLRDAGFSPSATRRAATLLDAHLLGFTLLDRGPSGTEDDEFETTLDLVLDAVAGLLGQDASGPSPGSGAQRPEPVEVLAPVLGVDGCRAGWVGALLVPGAPRPRVVVASTLAELVETVRAEVAVRVVGVDIPIGLPDASTRAADALARRALGGRASSVFTTLTRAAYSEDTRVDADAVNRRLSGQGVGAQAFALREKILEADRWVRSRPTVEVLEVHPEVSFVEMAGGPMPAGKRTEAGRAARLDALAAAGIARPSVLEGSGYAADDVIDACAVAWTAARRVAGLSRSMPDPPEVFSDGIPAAIHV